MRIWVIFFWLYRGWNAFADVNLEQLICSSRMSIEAGSQVEIIVTNPFTSVEMTSMVEDWFTVAWCCVVLGNCAVYATCWAWLPQQQAQPPIYFPLEGCPLTIMDYLGHGVWNAWRCPSCAGREGQHLLAFGSLAGRMGLEVRWECGSGHSLLVLTGICYSQDILPWQTRIVWQENVSDIQGLFKFYFIFSH